MSEPAMARVKISSGVRPIIRREVSAKGEGSERGNILVLGLTLWLVACLLLMGTISLTLLSLERRELLAAADAIALEIADDIDDVVTQDMMVGRLAAHDKDMWMIRSHVS